MHDTLVIKTDPEGEFAYTNIRIAKKQSVLLNICRAYFLRGNVKFGLFYFLNSCLSGARGLAVPKKSLLLGNFFR